VAKVAIVGTGFVGASLGLALRKSKLFDTIAGWDVDRGRLQAAFRLGAIDEEARQAASAADHAAVIVLAVPFDQLERALEAIVPGIFAGAVVTETTLWKVPAQRLASEVLHPETEFIGGRPVLDRRAGGEASADVLRHAIYCLTPSSDSSQDAINALSAVVTAAGAQPYFLDAAEHDALTAAGELLPGAVLASLATALTGDPSWKDASHLAGDPFNRLAELAEELPSTFWQEACDNSAALARWLDAAADRLLDLRHRIQPGAATDLDGEWRVTLEALARWRRERRQLQESTMPPKSELKPNLFGSLGRRRGPSGPGRA